MITIIISYWLIKQGFPVRRFLRNILMLALFLLCAVPAFSLGSTEKSATAAYYAGRVEEAAAALEKQNDPGAKKALVPLYWELGENARAAGLLEELLENPKLDTEDANELRRQLFYTCYLMGNYSGAAALRGTVESSFKEANSLPLAEFYFYSAAVYEEMGDAGKAADTYKKSLDINKWRPIAWYKRGMLLRQKDPKEAEQCLQTCWNQDNSFTAALLPLARLLAAREAWNSARNYLSIANARLPANREIAAALAEVRKNASSAGASGINPIEQQIRANPPKVTPAPSIPEEGTMRIGLAERRSLVSVKAGGSFVIRREGESGELYRGEAREQFWVEWNKGTIIIRDNNSRTLVRGTTPLVYELRSNEDSSIVAGVVNGAPGVNRTYRGALEFRPGREGLTVVNIVPMEEYLYGVIPAEMPATWPGEALKAQTIAARAYSIANRGLFSERGFDLYGTPHSMAYQGVGVEHKNTTAAIDATRGMILTGGKEPLKAYFSANHGGYSEDSLAMWGYDSYMKPVPDKLLPLRDSPLSPDALYRWVKDNPSTYSNVPRYSYIPAYRWEKWVSPEEIRRRLPEDSGDITRIVSRGRGISGRIAELEVQGSKQRVMVKADAIWSAMGGLRSSLFTIRYKYTQGKLEYIIFQGAGYGHGIGLDQHGAAGMANAGFSAEDILRHYYPRAEMKQL